MQRFKTFFVEGGNIKVGRVSAAPFNVSSQNRGERQKDIRQALGHIHDTFHSQHGEHLFGKNKRNLISGRTFTGSTSDMMNRRLSHKEFAKYKPVVGDIDTQIASKHKDKLGELLSNGRRFGKYTIVGTKKHGNEISAVMRHENGEHHQIDFQGVNSPGSPKSRFLHSSNWQDTKSGIKGAHHKMLINAVGGDQHKFSITHGLRSRSNENDKGVKEPHKVTHTLFGPQADKSKIGSFKGVVDLIKKHRPHHEHQTIYDKFKSSVSGKKGIDHTAALEHMRKHLNVRDNVNEAVDENAHHTTVVPLMGVSPISHMGHAHDIGKKVNSLPGTKHIGLSAKADVFDPQERKKIMKKQWGHRDTKFHIVASAGDTIKKAHDSLPKDGKKILHIVVGSDRKEFGHKIKHALENGKIKEMGNNKWHEIHVHTPDDSNRTHGMSGTKMRHAAHTGDYHTFKKHLGVMFNDTQVKSIMAKTQAGIVSGKIKLKR